MESWALTRLRDALRIAENNLRGADIAFSVAQKRVDELDQEIEDLCVAITILEGKSAEAV